MQNAITDVPGILVGHATNLKAMTGCTVILAEDGAISGVDQRGGAPGTRETDALRPMHLVDKAHAVLLAGGSAFGLDAATGVMRFLEEKGVGFDSGFARVPIVPAAVLYDLGIGLPDVRPDAEMGYIACQNASQAAPAEGNVGAGTGATVGKILGMSQAMKSGLGTASIDLGGGLVVGTIVAVNALGDIVDPETGKILAGARAISVAPNARPQLANTLVIMKSLLGKTALRISSAHNTVIGVVATNARLDKEETNKVAQMAHNGLARSIRPAHTMYDGDTVFALATGRKRADVNTIGAYAAECMAAAIVRAALQATSANGLPAARDLKS
ncbi:L-aminopeptidase/D-esterase [Longilinea arvoryzae]|uniref:L-aminopeptidase/D-esterase n=1 Tax=Longilinea arvoryzae TaxID=360412 RepID=A0A0S7BJU1_9CHLR|nr:P1 family peptidase [Longilinea arvoryzae]GAP14758.1 L-aminopeptidase/D-esterase [Longilinea arvoryzae]